MSTRATVILRSKDREINLWCRSDGYIKSDNGFGLGVDIINSVNELLSFDNKKLTRNIDLNIVNLANLLIYNNQKESLEFHNNKQTGIYWGGTLSILQCFDEQAPHSLIYTLYSDKIHIQGYDYTKDACEWSDCLFEGTYKEFAKFLKNYEMKW